MKLINQTGTLKMDYKIICRQIEGSEFADVSLYIGFPEDQIFFDVVTQISEDTYKNNLRVALLKAEERWNIDLLKMDIEYINA